jgi:hypothetical protein
MPLDSGVTDQYLYVTNRYQIKLLLVPALECKENPMSRCLDAFNAFSLAARNSELNMAEALNDPLIRTIMDADGVDPEILETEFLQIASSRAEALEA